MMKSITIGINGGNTLTSADRRVIIVNKWRRF